ncbi:DUF2075 domain-containing protein [Ideonella alba]|nr:DUF2075 domain-containing protein [Ideonella alba]
MAWLEQMRILRAALPTYAARGNIYFEYVLPRLGRRIDAVLVVDQVVFVLEFKAGEIEFKAAALDQVWDYALDLKNFHETSHDKVIVPILIATRSDWTETILPPADADSVLRPVRASVQGLPGILKLALHQLPGKPIFAKAWEQGRYSPTPTIVEAAKALYGGHSVSDISRNDAGATNLSITSSYLSEVIADARSSKKKVVCLLTGVPGAGKTLVGLDIAAKHIDKLDDLHSVFLSGNGPLVAILREALVRDKVDRERIAGRKLTKSHARRSVEVFIQNVHHFRDECLQDTAQPPTEHVAIFDEAQRAWDREQTTRFMARKSNHSQFNMSEPVFLLSCMDRHKDWAVVICLIGGGQEINTGEAGISEWINALTNNFHGWRIHMSSRLQDSEYGAGAAVSAAAALPTTKFTDALHLNVSLRSFRAERVSDFVKQLLDIEEAAAAASLEKLLPRFPLVVTRDLDRAREWLRGKARGTERYGLVVSSQAQRLKPHAIDVRAPVEPVNWFLGSKDDVRSSYYLEDVATEFQVQGLELDWVGVVWDADFRFNGCEWDPWSFVGDRWQRIRKSDRRTYLKNAYRVLLTRARQGMVIVVPPGSSRDHTRIPSYYDSTFQYLQRVGIPLI